MRPQSPGLAKSAPPWSRALGVSNRESFTLLGRIAAWARRCWTKGRACVREWRQRARSRRDLMALDDRELWDFHLTRVEAMNEAGKPFWKR